MMLGMTYSPKGKYQSRYAEAADYVDYYKLTRELQKKVDALNTQVEDLQHQLESTDSRTKENEKRLDAYKYDYRGEY
jgi:peptidoglycan hydrolase CwlO-like protein